MVWVLLFTLAIVSGSLHGEDLDRIRNSGIHFHLSESGDEKPWPIIQGAKPQWNLLLGEFPIYTLAYRQPMMAVLEQVQNQTGEIRCDCGLFVQIAAQINSQDTAVLFPPSENYPEAIACACGSDLAYLRIENQSSHESLQRTAFMNKGMWLIPMGDDLYLGLAKEGPLVADEKEWSDRLENGLLCELELSHIPESERRYAKLLLKRGFIGRWKVDQFSREWPEEHRLGMERILARVRHSP